MRPALLTALALTLLSAGARAEVTGQQLAEGAGRPLIGSPAPRLVVKTIDGQSIDLGRLYGKQAVYLKFWATWCVPCREQMPHFERTYENAGPDLAVIAINTGFNDTLEEVRAYRQKLGITMPIVLDDGEVGAAFNLRVTPQHIVIGRDGRIQYVGHLADARLDAALAAARESPAPNASGGAASQGSAATNAPAAPLTHYGVGDQLPDQSPQMLDGQPFKFRGAGNKGHTVLVFLSPWCESYLETTRPALSANCRRTREQVDALAGERGVRWLGVASGLWATSDDLRGYQSKHHVRIPLTLDDSGQLFHSFGINQVPTVLVADADGRILRRVDGAQIESAAALRKVISER